MLHEVKHCDTCTCEPVEVPGPNSTPERWCVVDMVNSGRAPKYEVALRVIYEILADGEWHPQNELREAGVDASDMVSKSVATILKDLRDHGHVEWENRKKKGIKYNFFYRAIDHSF